MIGYEDVTLEIVESATIYAPSTQEDDMCDYLVGQLKSYVDDVFVDSKKNVIGYKDNGSDTTIVIDAHIDEIPKDREWHNYVPVVDGYIISGKAMDDRVGVVSMLEVAKRIDNDVIDANIIYLGASQEELGQIGAKYFVKNTEYSIDYTFAIDVTWVEPGIDMGKGPAITTEDVPHNFELTDITLEAAKNAGIEHQISKYGYGFDARTTDALPYVINNIDTTIFSIPVTNMHTTNPVKDPSKVDVRDVDTTTEIILTSIYELAGK